MTRRANMNRLAPTLTRAERRASLTERLRAAHAACGDREYADLLYGALLDELGEARS